MSSQFGVDKKWCQAPIIFAVYINGLLIRLEETNVGCHMGICFIGTLAFADDLNLLALTLCGLKILIDICENYAKEFNTKYNWSNSCLHLFKGRNCKISTRGVTVNIVSPNVSENVFHHTNAAKNSYSINVLKEMIDVIDEFKECQGFSREEVEGFIEMLCIDWLFLTYLF